MMCEREKRKLKEVDTQVLVSTSKEEEMQQENREAKTKTRRAKRFHQNRERERERERGEREEKTKIKRGKHAGVGKHVKRRRNAITTIGSKDNDELSKRIHHNKEKGERKTNQNERSSKQILENAPKEEEMQKKIRS